MIKNHILKLFEFLIRLS